MKILSLVILFSTLIFSLNLDCKKLFGGYKCSNSALELELFAMKEKWPIKLDNGEKIDFNIDSKSINCYLDRDKNEIECPIELGNKGWHLYSKNANSIDKNILKEIINLLKGSNQNSSENNFLDIALDSINYFKESIKNKDFTPFYNNISKLWREQTSKENLEKSFITILQSANLVLDILQREPKLKEKKIDDKSLLHITLEYPATAKSVGAEVKLDYLKEGGEWKLYGFEIEPTKAKEITQDSSNKDKNILDINSINATLKGDINGDGKVEIVALHKFAQKEVGDFYQILVYDSNGKLLWSGPKEADSGNSYVFGEWDFGISMPQVLIDINEDNHLELLAPAPQSDVSVQFFRIFAWNGQRFVNLKPAGLILSNNQKDHFIWVNPVPKDYSRVWVNELIPIDSKDSAKARITHLKRDGSVESALAILKFTSTGADVVKWIEPLKLNSTKEKSYIAKISSKDHFNSRGVRLKTIQEILHQDRANYYKGKRDLEDSDANYFNTPKKRAQIDRMEVKAVNVSLKRLKDLVVNSNPLLKVTIKPNILEVELLK